MSKISNPLVKGHPDLRKIKIVPHHLFIIEMCRNILLIFYCFIKFSFFASVFGQNIIFVGVNFVINWHKIICFYSIYSGDIYTKKWPVM